MQQVTRAVFILTLAGILGCAGLGWFGGVSGGGGVIEGDRGSDYDSRQVGLFFGLHGGFGPKSDSRPIPVYVTLPPPHVEEVVEEDQGDEEDIPHHHHSEDTLDGVDGEDPSSVWVDDWGPAGVVIAGLMAVILGLLHAVKPEWTRPFIGLVRRFLHM